MPAELQTPQLPISVEERLRLLERRVQELEERDRPRTVESWLASFQPIAEEDVEAFEEMIRLGREFRDADRPKDEECDTP
jgi:endonuclease III